MSIFFIFTHFFNLSTLACADVWKYKGGFINGVPSRVRIYQLGSAPTLESQRRFQYRRTQQGPNLSTQVCADVWKAKGGFIIGIPRTAGSPFWSLSKA